MSLKSVSTDSLMQLAEVVGQLTDADYARPLAVLSGNTVGKHIRHILEFYQLLVSSAETGHVNYDRRQRDGQLEVDTTEALQCIGTIDRAIHRLNLNQPLHLEADLSVAGAESIQILSTVARELLYNIEHAIHHMALIQVALRNAFPGVVVPEHFGVAYSTAQHQTH